MNIVQKAINFASIAHRNQTRKATEIPYITHPFAVGMLLQKERCSDSVIAAGILHDTLEDTDTNYDTLVENFGEHIASLVRVASEQDKTLPWHVRKQHTIDMLKDLSLEEIQVITADKLHNLQSISADLETIGDKVWERLNQGVTDQHWYYASIVKELAPRKKEFTLIRELELEVVQLFGTLKFPSNDDPNRS
ncbi:HD domain-containing protein [Neobacillus sp. OS1-33]|uniref:HD domain-containing protein n=1 Tax=Neobacillus sp. OS1-33 TaxID=3070683 RepID=UPI0027E19D77|nr:HD domain-containing protein [Neobacillus sp. OS1-33]WML26373.1 HD domain-containing protein [Neobacillus sp. OS1-33]